MKYTACRDFLAGIFTGAVVFILAFTACTGLLILSLAAIDEIGQQVPALANPVSGLVNIVQPAVAYLFLVILYNPLPSLIITAAMGVLVHHLGWGDWL